MESEKRRIQIDSLDEANEVIFESDRVIRVQPKAPGCTRYYYIDDELGWVRKKAGFDYQTQMRVDDIRSIIKRNIPRNERKGGGGVTAVKREDMC